MQEGHHAGGVLKKLVHCHMVAEGLLVAPDVADNAMLLLDTLAARSGEVRGLVYSFQRFQRFKCQR